MKLWRAAPPVINDEAAGAAHWQRRFLQGVSLQLTNPKPLVFFLAVLPQFMHRGAPGTAARFAVLVLTYVLLIGLIHGAYAVGASQARRFLASPSAARWVNRGGAVAFVILGALLALSSHR